MLSSVFNGAPEAGHPGSPYHTRTMIENVVASLVKGAITAPSIGIERPVLDDLMFALMLWDFVRRNDGETIAAAGSPPRARPISAHRRVFSLLQGRSIWI